MASELGKAAQERSSCVICNEQKVGRVLLSKNKHRNSPGPGLGVCSCGRVKCHGASIAEHGCATFVSVDQIHSSQTGKRCTLLGLALLLFFSISVLPW